jgi:hypothetical protein
VGLPLAFEVPLLGGDALRTAEDRIAAQVLVALKRSSLDFAGQIPPISSSIL